MFPHCNNKHRITTIRSRCKNVHHNNNKSAQSNLGRGPRRGTVAHVRRKVPIGYNGAPEIRSQKYSSPLTDHQTPLPASSLDLSDLWCQTASRSDPPFFPHCTGQTDAPTDRPTHRLIDRPRESFIKRPCLLYTSPSPRDRTRSRMPSSA